MAGIPYGLLLIIATFDIATTNCSDVLCVALFALIWIIFSIVLGVICGVLFVKVRLRMPSHSFLAKALIFSFAVWLVLSVSPGWAYLGAKWRIPQVLELSNIASLVGLILWGVIFYFTYKRQVKGSSPSQPKAPIYDSDQRSTVKAAAFGLIWVMDIVMILMLFFSSLWNLSLQLFALTIIILLFGGKKKMDELSKLEFPEASKVENPKNP